MARGLEVGIISGDRGRRGVWLRRMMRLCWGAVAFGKFDKWNQDSAVASLGVGLSRRTRGALRRVRGKGIIS